MTDELERYIEAHIGREPEELGRIDRETNLRTVNGRMCSGHLQGRLLKMLVRMIRPRRVLELGTFTGYSALCMAEGLEDDACVDTLEADDELEDIIRANLARVEWGRRVRLHIGDAEELMASMEPGSYDPVFIDADKRRYPAYYEAARRLTRPGGYIIADNTLWDGHVTEEGKHAPQTRGVMAFNDMVASDEGVECVILPLRDGMSVIRVKLGVAASRRLREARLPGEKIPTDSPGGGETPPLPNQAGQGGGETPPLPGRFAQG